MIVQRIKPLRVQPVTTPQCCVKVTDFTPQQWNKEYLKRRTKKCEDKGYDPKCCQQQASYEIDGKHYCTKHAGQIALNILTAPKTWTKDERP